MMGEEKIIVKQCNVDSTVCLSRCVSLMISTIKFYGHVMVCVFYVHITLCSIRIQECGDLATKLV